MRIRTEADLDRVDFAKGNGLVPVVTQHAGTGAVLMLAYASREALERTLADGEMWYFSRSRDRLWRKGETSGNTQRMVALHTDCDADTVLARVVPAGPACHTGERTCFGDAADPTLAAVDTVIAARAVDRPAGSHTVRLLDDRNLRLKKLGEEATELALACADGDPASVAEETADLVYHALVACRAAGVGLDDVLAALARRLPGAGNHGGSDGVSPAAEG